MQGTEETAVKLGRLFSKETFLKNSISHQENELKVVQKEINELMWIPISWNDLIKYILDNPKEHYLDNPAVKSSPSSQNYHNTDVHNGLLELDGYKKGVVEVGSTLYVHYQYLSYDYLHCQLDKLRIQYINSFNKIKMTNMDCKEKVLLLQLLLLDIRRGWDSSKTKIFKDKRVWKAIQLVNEIEYKHGEEMQELWKGFNYNIPHKILVNLGLYLTGQYEGRIFNSSYFDGGYEGLGDVHGLSENDFVDRTVEFKEIAKTHLLFLKDDWSGIEYRF
jgi:hypothetical protein